MKATDIAVGAAHVVRNTQNKPNHRENILDPKRSGTSDSALTRPVLSCASGTPTFRKTGRAHRWEDGVHGVVRVLSPQPQSEASGPGWPQCPGSHPHSLALQMPASTWHPLLLTTNTRVHTHPRTRTHTYTHIHARVRTRTHTSMHTYAHIHARVRTRAQICTDVTVSVR